MKKFKEKRLLSAILVVIILITILPFAALAADDGSSSDETVTPLTSASISTTDSIEPTSQEEKYLLGDADQDGKITVKDATKIQKHVAKILTLTGTVLKAADTDGDGKTTVKDASVVQKFVAKISVPNSKIGQLISSSEETQPSAPLYPINGVNGNWAYLEYEDYVVLTDYRLDPNSLAQSASAQDGSNSPKAVFDREVTSVKPKLQTLVNTIPAAESDTAVTIPDKISDKPVVDITEECFASIREQNRDDGCFSATITLVVSKDNPYFSIDDRSDGGRKYYTLYNKERTTLFYACVYDGNPYIIPKTVTKIYDAALVSVGTGLEIEDGSESFVIEDNMLLTKDKTRLIACANRLASLVSYKVPDTVTKMDEGAFYNIWVYYDGGIPIDNPVRVELPQGLKEIPDGAFADGWAVPVSIPESVERIGIYALAFHFNKERLSLIIPKNVNEIGMYAFYTSKVNVTIDEDNQWFTLENGVLYNKDKSEIMF